MNKTDDEICREKFGVDCDTEIEILRVADSSMDKLLEEFTNRLQDLVNKYSKEYQFLGRAVVIAAYDSNNKKHKVCATGAYGCKSHLLECIDAVMKDIKGAHK